jgi:cardiolipin synthase (CMP-forming)
MANLPRYLEGHYISKETFLNRSASPINIPNMLTVGRFVLTPVFIILLLRHQYGHALVIFAIASVSDALDGFIARRYDQRTPLGACLDPIADKLLHASAYITMTLLGLIPAWITVLVIVRDVTLVLGVAVITLTRKPYEVRPTIFGKASTLFQMLYVVVTLLDPQQLSMAAMHPILLWVTAMVTAFSGLHYFFNGMSSMRKPPAAF